MSKAYFLIVRNTSEDESQRYRVIIQLDYAGDGHAVTISQQKADTLQRAKALAKAAAAEYGQGWEKIIY